MQSRKSGAKPQSARAHPACSLALRETVGARLCSLALATPSYCWQAVVACANALWDSGEPGRNEKSVSVLAE